MNNKTKLMIAGIFAAMLLILAACTNEKLAQTPQQQPSAQPQSNQQIQQPEQPLGIQITTQEEMDGIDQAITELEETDAQ